MRNSASPLQYKRCCATRVHTHNKMEMSQEEPATQLTVQTVVRNMRTRPTTKATQQACVLTLYNMMIEEYEYENTRSFLQCGGVEVLFDAMRLT
jgi:hypothetical protein